MKKIIVMFGIILTVFLLVSCENSQQTYTFEEVLETIKIGYQGSDSITSVTQDLVLPLTSSLDGNAVISWESTNLDVISHTGVVTRPESDTQVTLVLSLRVGSVSKQLQYTVTVIGTQVYYTVTFDVDGSLSEISVLQNQTVTQPEDPSKDGYAFIGWFKNDFPYDFYETVVADFTLVAVFEQQLDANYAIEYYVQNITDDGYTRQSNQIMTGTVGETITLTPERTGFVVNTTQSILSGVVTSDSPLILKVYFDRLLFTATYMIDDEVYQTETLRYEGIIENLSAPEVAYYNFVGWFTDQALTVALNQNTPITEDIMLYAKYEMTTISTYSITIYYENIEDTNYTFISETTYEGTIGETITYEEVVTGMTINDSMSVTSGVITFAQTIELEVYYDRNWYDVTFMDDDQTLGIVSVKYQDTVDPIPSPTKDNYTFLGWTQTILSTTLYDFETQITKDLTLYTIWQYNDPFSYSGYYEGAEGLVGNQLESFLRTITTTGFVGISYGDSRYILDETDRDPNNASKVILVYLGTSVSGTWDGGITWNREHVWPQSLLGVSVDNSSINQGSDLQNLKPADPAENSSRSNKFFDNTTTTISYEPRDEVKGDVARILFYMTVRYDFLELVTVTGGAEPLTYQMANLATLLQWHEDDPVDSFEMNRNEVIYNYQHNRNPFIDHPEFVDKLWGASAQSIAYTPVMIQPSLPMSSMIQSTTY